MPEYVITPEEPPTWRLDPHDFLRRINDQWPSARTRINPDSDDPMATEALVRIGPGHRELGVALSNQGYAVYLDPSDPETAAEFAEWYARQLPALEPTTYLFTMDYEIQIPLTPQTTANDILKVLAA